MELNIPALIVLIGPDACSLSADLEASFLEHLSKNALRSVMLWRVDAEGNFKQASDLAQWDFQWTDLEKAGFMETIFQDDYQKMMDRQIDGRVLLNTCYLCVVSSGAQAKPEMLAAIRNRLNLTLQNMNKRLRTHWLWLVDDNVRNLSSSYEMLQNDLENKTRELEDFERITTLSANQDNGAYSYATRKERIDAMVPCILDVANASQLVGAKIQTMAYRKLNCSSGELRRLLSHRACEVLKEWQSAPLDLLQMWNVFSSDDLTLSRWSDLDAPSMAQSLMRQQRQILPSAGEMLLAPNPDRLDDAVEMVKSFEQNNDAALFENLSGEEWGARWKRTVLENVRNVFALNTLLEFIKPQGTLHTRLKMLIDEAGKQGGAYRYSSVATASGGLFGRKSAEIRTFEMVANTYLDKLAFRVLEAKLRQLVTMLEPMRGELQALVNQTSEALTKQILSSEEVSLYHAFASAYDETVISALSEINHQDRDVLGENTVYYPAAAEDLTSLWQDYHQKLITYVLTEQPTLSASFSQAYIQGKTPNQVEQELRNKLSVCKWQLTGGNIIESGKVCYYANELIGSLFPLRKLTGDPLEIIPGDLIEYARFGEVADNLAGLANFTPFRPGKSFTVNPEALERIRAERPQTAESEVLVTPEVSVSQNENPWNIRLDRRGDVFVIIWSWPEGHVRDARIRIEHANGERTTLSCSLDVYQLLTGRIIPSEDLGIGQNRITVIHDNQSSTITATGRCISAYYSIRDLGKTKKINLSYDRVDMTFYELRITLADLTFISNLRLVGVSQRGVQLSYPVPEPQESPDGDMVSRFYCSLNNMILVPEKQLEGILACIMNVDPCRLRG